ncbi:MAG: TIGR02757 family protein [Bacteroidaceae bacterium]|nr:TIGR02757 family protein [Bacteroidaceae bacterium]
MSRIDRKLLIELAEKYETADFIKGDPSWFMHQVEGDGNKEAIAFIASCFSYGSRKQFMPKVQLLLDDSKGNVCQWLMAADYKAVVPENDACFYRLYTNRMVLDLLERLAECYRESGSLKNLLIEKNVSTALDALEVLTKTFGGKIVPKNTASSCKRLCMFLRWMVRTDSPVDLGLWADIVDKKTLIMPLDTHVMQQANRLQLIETKATSMSTALKLSKEVAKFFPDDPLKADYALFGYGVNAK